MKGVKVMAKRSMKKSFDHLLTETTDKIIVRRIAKSLKERNHILARRLEILLNMATRIGVPRTEDEIEILEWVSDNYKNLLSEIEQEMAQVESEIAYYHREDF